MGRDISQSFIGLQGAISYASILLSPITFGLLAEKLSTDIVSLFQIIAFVITAISTCIMLKHSKQIQPMVEKLKINFCYIYFLKNSPYNAVVTG